MTEPKFQRCSIDQIGKGNEVHCLRCGKLDERERNFLKLLQTRL